MKQCVPHPPPHTGRSLLLLRFGTRKRCPFHHRVRCSLWYSRSMVRNAFVISDIHLGASTSLLTAIDYDVASGGTLKRPLAEEVLDRLIADLREYIVEGEKIEQCILLGDIFDLSFAPYGLAMKNGRWFFQKLIDADLFEHFVYIPGNHDHHLWQQVCEHYYLMTELGNPPLSYPRTLPARMLLDNTFLDGLLPGDHQLLVTYPNYETAINGQHFFFHHGHYLQKLYIAASNLLADTIHTQDIEDLEVLNAPFLEFGWYNLGQAYNLGAQKLIDRLYFMFKNNQTEQFDRLMRLFLQKIDQWETSPGAKRRRWNPLGMITDTVIKALGPYLLKRLFFKHSRLFKKRQHASSVRHERLSGSLHKPVVDYISKYMIPNVPDCKECHFIFGHTHEPEENFVCYDDKERCYHIYNTGGWVVDLLDDHGELVVPQMAPIYLAEDGSVNALPFTEKHHDFLAQRLKEDPLFQKIRTEQMR
jgi:hypothetical protein